MSAHTVKGTEPEHSFDRLKELDAYFDDQLKRYSGGAADNPDRKKGYGRTVRVWLFRLLLVVLFILLPFYLLIRVSLVVYETYQLNGWLALLAGGTATVILLLLYSAFISYLFSGTAKVHRYIRRGVVGLVLAYCCYGLLYLSSYNVKNGELRTYYRSLHPILRVTLATATIADPNLIVTDMRRTPGDYSKMGLAPRRQSLHYEQETGYVHAVDLRTIGKAEWKNWVTEQSLNVLGFKTLRHEGTADHLHVALPLND